MITIAIAQMGNDLFRKYMKSKYVESIKRAGADVKWIELDDAQQAVKDAIKCDGLLLSGGADINPEMYGEIRNEKCGKPNELRDTVEPLLLDAFIKAKKPVFAICRGFQLLNVCMGGTLIQDIKEEQKCKHMDFFSRAGSIHKINIEENSLLYSIMGSACESVNSMHHQAICKVAECLNPTAISEDGYVEALELKEYPFCLGVQWHPEHMSKKSETQRKLFVAFIDACKNGSKQD